MKKQITSISKQELLSLYLQFEGDCYKIQQFLFEYKNINVTYFSVLRRLKRDGAFSDPRALSLFHKNSGGRNPGQKRSVNENFFDEWNPKSAYIFGVIAGDGSVHNTENKIRICAGVDEKNFIEMVKKEIGSDAKTSYQKSTNKHGSVGESLSFAISSKKLKDRLIELGLSDNKNENGFTLAQCPFKFQGDLLRGLYDTDGSLAKFNTKDGARPRSISWASKHLEVIHEIEQILNSRNMTKIRIDSNNKGIYSIHCGDLNELVSFLYQNAGNLYLKRKRPDLYEQYKGTLDMYDQNKGHIHLLKDEILALRKKGVFIKDIAKQLKICKDSVQRIITAEKKSL